MMFDLTNQFELKSQGKQKELPHASPWQVAVRKNSGHAAPLKYGLEGTIPLSSTICRDR